MSNTSGLRIESSNRQQDQRRIGSNQSTCLSPCSSSSSFSPPPVPLGARPPCPRTLRRLPPYTAHVTSISASRPGLAGHLLGADFSSLTFLSELDLSFNLLSGDLPILPLPLRHLTTLDFRSNVFLHIPDGFFAAFPALEAFFLDDNEVPIGKIPADVSGCSGLRSFSANNFFGNATLFPALESLSLARNQLCCSISSLFGQNNEIKFLDMSGQLHEGDNAKLTSNVR
ncbi:hypothetical protein E2562_020259 [Oryza meyeriana var. granulata]|uniref:non-specific serine/threonine protein kinase n=1 Tax=Oryza meyeriana var. granulata TaxID=110450 RepID=A0A6G1DM03_9ORYZ|nr:hypothetical protein E2562_020259 [Oryza meyeriana var. granulata]